MIVIDFANGYRSLIHSTCRLHTVRFHHMYKKSAHVLMFARVMIISNSICTIEPFMMLSKILFRSHKLTIDVLWIEEKRNELRTQRQKHEFVLFLAIGKLYLN